KQVRSGRRWFSALLVLSAYAPHPFCAMRIQHETTGEGKLTRRSLLLFPAQAEFCLNQLRRTEGARQRIEYHLLGVAYHLATVCTISSLLERERDDIFA